MSGVRGTVVLDWDGICEDTYGQRPNGDSRYDFEGIDEAHRRGYAVAISTCNNVGFISRVLEDRGYRAIPVSAYGVCYWEDPSGLILVTNIKISGWYLDDRALVRGEASLWRFPVDWREVFRQIEIAESHPERLQEGW